MLEQSPTWFQLNLFPTNKMKIGQTISGSKVQLSVQMSSAAFLHPHLPMSCRCAQPFHMPPLQSVFPLHSRHRNKTKHTSGQHWKLKEKLRSTIATVNSSKTNGSIWIINPCSTDTHVLPNENDALTPASPEVAFGSLQPNFQFLLPSP